MTTNNIWVLVATYVINASIASILMILYTRWWLKKRLGKVKVKLQVANKTQTQWIPTNRPNPTFIQKALERN
jgi:hypothetical protein